MKKLYFTGISLLLMSLTYNAFAGNGDRVGQAGASQLLINPWSRSSGWAGANSASVRGVEASFLNVAGTAFTAKTDLMFSRTDWLKGTGISLNAFGLNQHVGESGVVGLSVTTMSFGDIQITTTDMPEGGLGTYNPTFSAVGLSYAKAFSNSIYGGINVKILSESSAQVSSQGFAFDAGIQYVAGKKENLKFGVALKNVGPAMHYEGDGLVQKVTVLPNNYQISVNNRAQKVELPSLFNIGVSYAHDLSENHKLTGALNFTSNSFIKDEYALGLEYGFKSILALRAGYTFFAKDAVNTDSYSSVLAGPALGASVAIPLGKNGKFLSFDYSYRTSRIFDGCHSIGARLNL